MLRDVIRVLISSGLTGGLAVGLGSVLMLGACRDGADPGTRLPSDQTVATAEQALSYMTLTGQTMGTSYHITIGAPKSLSQADLQAQIDTRLQEINASMSTYDPKSTISEYNRLPVGQSMIVDADFIKVLADSRTVYEASERVFDPTVLPLVELWGFGRQMSVERLQQPPTAAQISAVRDRVGLDKVILIGDQLSKSADGVGLDFSTIAKGYGVDVIASVIEQAGISHYMVEIGGEIATRGRNAKGKPWILAIDQPVLDSTIKNRQIATTISSDEPMYLATSGNYRNSLEYDGVRYSHTISPITARPVANGSASVTVVHDSTALADAWATALSALPLDDAIALAQKQGICALFINPEHERWAMYGTDAYQRRFGR